MSVHAIVLAAGRGTRMNSEVAKVLHEAAGRSLLAWVLDSIEAAAADRTIVVVGHQADGVAGSLPAGVEWVLQEPQNGTGHAVQVAMAHLGALDTDATVIVAYGDMPLVPGEVYRGLAERESGVAATVVTVDPGPPGFGRIVRDDGGAVGAVVEERDCTPAHQAITERNAGIYSFRAGALTSALSQLTADNDQGELYLTDVIGILVAAGGSIETLAVGDEEVTGVNSHRQLAAVEAVLRRRRNDELMESGVWMLDPGRVYVDAAATVEPGALLYPDTYLRGDTTVRAGASVGPDVFASDSIIGPGAVVRYSVLRGAQVGADVSVGPYASLRPGSVLETGSKVGTFVETKNTVIGEGAKLPHLSYFGDATVGRDVNVGAGSITCNYDGYEKHHTVIGDDAFIGSDTMLVAPVTIGDRAVTGAGSVITGDVAPGSLAVERSPQHQVQGYADRRAARRRARDAEEGN